MSTMRAVAFRGTNRLVLEDRPKPQPKAGQAVILHHDDDDLRHRRAHRQRRVSGAAGTGPRTRTRRGHRGAR